MVVLFLPRFLIWALMTLKGLDLNLLRIAKLYRYVSLAYSSLNCSDLAHLGVINAIGSWNVYCFITLLATISCWKSNHITCKPSAASKFRGRVLKIDLSFADHHWRFAFLVVRIIYVYLPPLPHFSCSFFLLLKISWGLFRWQANHDYRFVVFMQFISSSSEVCEFIFFFFHFKFHVGISCEQKQNYNSKGLPTFTSSWG